MTFLLIATVFSPKSVFFFLISKWYISYQLFSQDGPQTSGWRGGPQTISGGAQDQDYFHNNTKVLFTFSIIEAFALLSQKQSWVKLLVPQEEPMQSLRTVLIVTTIQSQFRTKRNKPVSLKNVLDKTVKVIHLIKSQPTCTYLFNIL